MNSVAVSLWYFRKFFLIIGRKRQGLNLNLGKKTGRMLCALTPGMKLVDWQRLGTLHRELQPYQFHVQRGGIVIFLECRLGKVPDLDDGFSVVRIPHWRLLPMWEILPPHFMRNIDLIKTNQSYRADIFIRLAKRLNKPSILRCGYIRGERMESVNGLTAEVKSYQEKEAWAFQNATMIQLPTKELAEWAIERYHLEGNNIKIVPNFVDSGLFKPTFRNNPFSNNTIISVGRLHSVKRFDLIINACSLLKDTKLRIAGEGPERNYLQRLASNLGVNLELVGQIANNKLPEFLSEGDIFVITSLREGHPKSLIEAMACGLPTICTNSPGIRNIVQDGVTSLVVSPDQEEIAEAIKFLQSNPKIRITLGKNARRFVIENYDISRVLNLDAAVIDIALRWDGICA